MAELTKQQFQSLWLAPQFLEGLSLLHCKDDAGEGEIELRHIDSPATDRGIVYEDLIALEALQNNKMIEIPVNDAGHRQFMQRRRLLAKALGSKPEAAGRLDDVASLAAVTRHAAFETKLLQRNPCAVIGQHHGKRRGAALDRLHLKYCWRSLHRVTPIGIIRRSP